MPQSKNISKYFSAILSTAIQTDCRKRHATALDMLREIYIRRGFSLHYSKSNYELAIYDFSRAIELRAKDVTEYAYRGMAHHNLGKHDLAIADFNMAINLASQMAFHTMAIESKFALVNSYLYRGMSYQEKGVNDLARLDLKKVLELTDVPQICELANVVLENIELDDEINRLKP